MKKIILTAWFVLLGGMLFSQSVKTESDYQITGQAIESTSAKGIPFATITVQKADNVKDLQKLCADDSGKFKIKLKERGNYKLIFSGVGFKQIIKEVQVGDSADFEIGRVEMEDGVELKELSVTAQKPLIKVEDDKIVYSMEADPESQTNNALEMMRKVPLIVVDGEDNVTLNGQSNFKVLVNGKSSSMMSANFKEVLKSLPANSIKDVEVITNPSSKYDAEGIGGIINIITIKKALNGYNGSISGGFDSFGALNGSAYFSAKASKLGFSGRYSIHQSRQPIGTSESTRENYLPSGENQYYMNSSGESVGKGNFQNFSGEVSYDIDSLNLISMSFWGYLGSNYHHGNTVTEILNREKERTSYYEMLSTAKYSYGTVSANLDYQKTFMKPDKTLTISYKIDNNPNISDNTSNTRKEFNFEGYKQHLLNNRFMREQTLQVDYFDPISKIHKIECGVKGIFRQNNGDADVFRMNPYSGVMQQDLASSNELIYNQTIVGLYGGYLYNPGKFSLKSGLRAELTWNDAVSKSLRDTSFSNTLKNIVPYITLTYKTKPTQTLKLSYTQRLYRPCIWHLNPYRNDLNRLFLNYGNPDLKSEIAHSLEAGYNSFTPKFNFGVSVTSSFSNNSIQRITFIDDSNVQHSTFDNIGKNVRTGLNTYLSYQPNGKFNISLNGGFSYLQMESTFMDKLQSNEGFNSRISVNSRIALWKDASFNVSGGYYSAPVRLQGKSSAQHYSNIGISQYLLKRKLSLNLSLSNPLTDKLTYQSEDITADFKYISTYTHYYRSLRFSVSYNFGKMGENVKKAKRSIQNDDVKSGEGGTN
jgi:outer membrane receptor protein involved in Fe transport